MINRIYTNFGMIKSDIEDFKKRMELLYDDDDDEGVLAIIHDRLTSIELTTNAIKGMYAAENNYDI